MLPRNNRPFLKIPGLESPNHDTEHNASRREVRLGLVFNLRNFKIVFISLKQEPLVPVFDLRGCCPVLPKVILTKFSSFPKTTILIEAKHIFRALSDIKASEGELGWVWLWIFILY